MIDANEKEVAIRKYTRRRPETKRECHGKSRTKIYRTWASMLTRCDRNAVDSFKYYGGRGIHVCERWLSFAAFYEDMGDPPGHGMQLDRIDTNGDYCKENCRWATKEENARNKRNSVLMTWRGQTKSRGEWSEITGIAIQLLYHRVTTLGWTDEEALSTPIRFHPKRKPKP